MSQAFTESVVEHAAHIWIDALGYAVLQCPIIAAAAARVANRTVGVA
jgi:hypothetical protein